jgi:hypothetical protein
VQTRRSNVASFAKMPTTSLRRSISPLSRSSKYDVRLGAVLDREFVYSQAGDFGTQFSVIAIGRVTQGHGWWHAIGQRLAHLRQRDLRLGLEAVAGGVNLRKSSEQAILAGLGGARVARGLVVGMSEARAVTAGSG